MKNRILLKEIPANEFDSAVFTTYSINLYYLEQQVLPLLGSKGINYISVLADGAMLTKQLDSFASLSQQRKRHYTIQGIQSNGAFHPKLIFLTGPKSILLLIGSGNLTSSGHGKNLEVWNSIYVAGIDDAKYGFVIHAWEYIKQLHANLGESASNKLKSIADNCHLLSNKEVLVGNKPISIDEHTEISFHANMLKSTLFSQVSEVIGSEKIKDITIMCPFHDKAGRFIQELNNRYGPKQINVIVQKNYGALPIDMPPMQNVRFFDWSSVFSLEKNFSYFHAKNIVFEGEYKNYLISGSANASIAAFGTQSIPAINQESCIVYQSTQSNYHSLLGINLKGRPVKLKDYEPSNMLDDPFEPSNNNLKVFILFAEKVAEMVSLLVDVKSKVDNAEVRLYDPKGVEIQAKVVSWQLGVNWEHLDVPHGTTIMFVKVLISGQYASNTQFVTDLNAFERTNPSPGNRSLNQIRKIIEGGNFSTLKVIGYLSAVGSPNNTKKGISKASTKQEHRDELPEDDIDLINISYAELQNRAKQIDAIDKPHRYIEYSGVRIWESIFLYLRQNSENKLQAKIDEEETEDINTSQGKDKGRNLKENDPQKPTISKSGFERNKKTVLKFLVDYYNILLGKVEDSKSEKPTLIDLSMYLIVMQILLHLVEHKVLVSGGAEEKHLLPIGFDRNEYSWSDYLVQYIGMFTMWSNQAGGFADADNIDYRLKMDSFMIDAFKTNICAISVCALVNEGCEIEESKQWRLINLLNNNLVFNASKHQFNDAQEFVSFIPESIMDEYGEAALEDSIINSLRDLNAFDTNNKDVKEGTIYQHPTIGFAYLSKITSNGANSFYKLYAPGFEWSDNANNFWNEKLYSVVNKTWLRTKKEYTQQLNIW